MATTLHRIGQLGLLTRDLTSMRVRPQGHGREQVVKRIVDRLGTMHGLPQKIGQLLAFSEIEGNNPRFARLTENDATWDSSEVFSTLEQEFGRPIASMFQHLATGGISASIGQVHRGILHDGTEVAVKVQYPGLLETLGIDIRAVGWLTAPASRIKKGFDPSEFHDEIRQTLLAELDFTREADAMDEMRQHAADMPQVHIPRVIRPMSTRGVITTAWMQGNRIQEIRDWPAQDRGKVSELILTLFLRGVMEWHLFHADPHPGNYRFGRENGVVNLGLLDFGCVKRTTALFSTGLVSLLESGRRGIKDADKILSHFLQMGFDERLLRPMRTKLPALAGILARPLIVKGSFDAAAWSPGKQIAQALGEDRMSFRLAGPPELLFFLRTFQGVLHYMTLLGTPISWGTIWDSVVRKTQSDEPQPGIGQPEAEDSRSLRIRVSEGGQIKVDLSFHASVARSLSQLIP